MQKQLTQEIKMYRDCALFSFMVAVLGFITNLCLVHSFTSNLQGLKATF